MRIKWNTVPEAVKAGLHPGEGDSASPTQKINLKTEPNSCALRVRGTPCSCIRKALMLTAVATESHKIVSSHVC